MVNGANREDKDNLEGILRGKVYRSLEEMPKKERRAHKVSYIMGMLPDDVNVSREWVEEFIDSRS